MRARQTCFCGLFGSETTVSRRCRSPEVSVNETPGRILQTSVIDKSEEHNNGYTCNDLSTSRIDWMVEDLWRPRPSSPNSRSWRPAASRPGRRRISSAVHQGGPCMQSVTLSERCCPIHLQSAPYLQVFPQPCFLQKMVRSRKPGTDNAASGMDSHLCLIRILTQKISACSLTQLFCSKFIQSV